MKTWKNWKKKKLKKTLEDCKDLLCSLWDMINFDKKKITIVQNISNFNEIPVKMSNQFFREIKKNKKNTILKT